MLCLCNAGQKNTLLLEPRALNSRTFEGLVGSNQWKDAAGNVIREASLAIWANFRRPALITVIAEINK
jgi:hypothetical protein